MAHFYGIVRGLGRTGAKRCGSLGSGIATTCASREGAVWVGAYSSKGTDFVEVLLMPWAGNGRRLTLYEGPISGAGAEEILREMHGRQLLSEPAREEWAQEPSGLIAPARRRLVL